MHKYNFSQALFWKIVGIALAVLLALWLTRGYLNSGFPYTHDGENHAVRFMNYAAAIREGQWPPRFAPYILSGYGFPVFQYNYPLANILAVPFIWIGIHPGQVFALQVVAFLTAGVLATWYISRQKFSRAASAFGVGWYALSSYLTTALFYRGNIGEILAYALVPIVIISIQKALGTFSRWWIVLATISLTAFFLVHNVLVVMMVPWGIVWGFSLAWQQKQVRRFCAICCTALALSLWFWIPALAELSLIVLQNDSLAQDAMKHTLNWTQLFFVPLRFGFSRSDTLDSLSMSMGWGTFFVGLIFVSACVQKIWLSQVRKVQEYKKLLFLSHHHRIFLLHIIMCASSVFLASDASIWVWKLIPQLSLFQFPWRFLFIASLACVPLSSWLFQQMTRKWQVVLWALLLLQLSWVWPVQVVDRTHKSAEYYLSAPHTSTTRNENRPITLPSMDLPSWYPTPQISNGEGTVEQIQLWKGSVRKYTVRAHSDVVIVEPTVFFPGWYVSVSDFSLSAPAQANMQGLLSYSLPARPDQPYHITTRFGQRTPARWVGEGLSVLALIASLIWFFAPVIFRKKQSGVKKTL